MSPEQVKVRVEEQLLAELKTLNSTLGEIRNAIFAFPEVLIAAALMSYQGTNRTKEDVARAATEYAVALLNHAASEAEGHKEG